MITSVTPVKVGDEVTGYTISFLYSDPITIYNGTQGEAGDTPQIGLTQDEAGDWYWTLNGELMTDADGNPIRANGEDGKDGQDGADGEDGQDGADGSDGRPGSTGRPGTPAPTPQIKLGSALTSGTYYGIDGTQQTAPDTGAWYLSVDNGASWYRISGENASSGSSDSTGAQGPAGPAGPQGPQGEKGDSFFAEAPELSEDGSHYIFTLADNTTISVPAYQSITIGEGTGTLTVAANGTSNITLTLDEDYTAIVAQITPEDDNTAIATRADNGWSVEATLNDGTATITVTAPASGKALLDVSLIRADGSKVTASRVLQAVNFITTENSTNINGTGDYVLKGSFGSSITITGGSPTIYLDGANVSAPISITNGANATIHVVGASNHVSTSGNSSAFLSSTVTIEGSGKDDALTVQGGYGAAGIGGYSDSGDGIPCGKIIIRNVTLTANSSNEENGSFGAGIGAAGDAEVKSIEISNAVVYVKGGGDGVNLGAAAIGGGIDTGSGDRQTSFDEIRITDSEIHATKGDSHASYIGCAGATPFPANYDIIPTAVITNSIIYNESGAMITQ